MGLADTASIDLIFEIPGSNGRLALAIVDDGAVRSDDGRDDLFRKKLASYLEFVASGELNERYPEYDSSLVKIVLICATAPTPSMLLVEAVRSPQRPDLVIPVEVLPRHELDAWLAAPG
jgi:hypothetical protein